MSVNSDTHTMITIPTLVGPIEYAHPKSVGMPDAATLEQVKANMLEHEVLRLRKRLTELGKGESWWSGK